MYIYIYICIHTYIHGYIHDIHIEKISSDMSTCANLAIEEGSPQMGRALVGFLAALGACFASGFGGVPWTRKSLAPWL